MQHIICLKIYALLKPNPATSFKNGGIRFSRIIINKQKFWKKWHNYVKPGVVYGGLYSMTWKTIL